MFFSLFVCGLSICVVSLYLCVVSLYLCVISLYLCVVSLYLCVDSLYLCVFFRYFLVHSICVSFSLFSRLLHRADCSSHITLSMCESFLSICASTLFVCLCSVQIAPVIVFRLHRSLCVQSTFSLRMCLSYLCVLCTMCVHLKLCRSWRQLRLWSTFYATLWRPS